MSVPWPWPKFQTVDFSYYRSASIMIISTLIIELVSIYTLLLNIGDGVT